jgi:uncharacterized protein (TIGR02172 family)
MKILGQPFAVGRTAEIYAWEEGTILKLYRDWCPANWVEHEAHIAHVVNQAGIPAPLVGEIVSVDGRRGIIYERVDGPDMLVAMKQNPLKLAIYARALAHLHIAMHKCVTTDLPSQRGGLVHSIKSAKTLPEKARQMALEKLEQLPEGSQLCHGDFHPGNVILTRRGPLVIDWMTAVQGHPAADVARTRLLLTIGDPPQGGAIRLVLLLGRRLYFRTYMETYRRSDPDVVQLSDAYLPVQAAARLNEEIAPEREKLIRMI